MLQWFRVHAALIAATVVVSLSAVGGTLAFGHQDDCHDAGCAGILVEHDASAHHVRAGGSRAEAHAPHCLVCHWARSFQPQPDVRTVRAPAAQAGAAVHVPVVRASTAAQAAQPPLRSPPAPPTFA